MADLKWGDEYRTTLLCVDGYEEGLITGRFYHPMRSEGEIFHNLSQYLLKMEDLLDEMGRPQSDTTTRSFRPSVRSENEKPCVSKGTNGEKATFKVRVLFRQHASWQGEAIWLEKGKTQRFRSVLELIHLLDSALR